MKSFYRQTGWALLSLLLALGGVCPVHGQEPASKDGAKQATGAGPRFRVSSWGEWKGPELFVRRGEDWIKLEILDLGYSSDLPMKRGEPVILAKKAKGEKGEFFQPVVTVPIAEDCRDPLVMLFAPEGDKVRHLLVDVDPRAIPWGSYYFVNFTGANLVGMVGRSQFSLPSGKSHLANPAKVANNRLAIQVKTAEENASEVVYSNMLINRPGKRMLVFFHSVKDATGGARIESRCLVDFRQE